jgi:septum formation protein
MRKIILASQSPRRRELLTQMGVTFEAIPSEFVENLDNARTPENVAMELGLGKALAVARLHPDAIVIGSDTIVSINGVQLGKPRDENEARKMLKLLAGQSNFVTTSLVVVCLADGVRAVLSETTEVHFWPYNENLVNAYIATGDYADKAGAYGVQSGAAPMIAYYRGNYDTVVGLPTHLLAKVLTQLGFPNVHPVELRAPVEKRG